MNTALPGKKYMDKKIGFDATSIKRDHDGGKNQVTLNLLRGFEKNGVSDQFVVFCLPETKQMIVQLIPHAKVVEVELEKMRPYLLAEIWLRTVVLPRYIKRFRVGVLLFPAFKTGLRRYCVPTVVIPHDIQSRLHKERFTTRARLIDAFCYHFDFKLRDKIIAVSDSDSHDIATVYPRHKNKIVTLYNPVDTGLFLSACAHIADKPYIATVNIQHRHKNTITLIKAFDKIKHLIPHDLYLVGRASKASEHLFAYVREHDLTQRVFFKGFLEEVPLAELVKGCALFVNPSLFEGFGMTTIEAMLAGVPALASRVSAVPEVTMGLCNYYEPADDANALAEAMKRLLLSGDRTSGSQLADISGKVDEQYNYLKISRQYFDLLTSLIR